MAEHRRSFSAASIFDHTARRLTFHRGACERQGTGTSHLSTEASRGCPGANTELVVRQGQHLDPVSTSTGSTSDVALWAPVPMHGESVRPAPRGRSWARYGGRLPGQWSRSLGCLAPASP